MAQLLEHPISFATPANSDEDALAAVRKLLAVCRERAMGLRAASQGASMGCFRTVFARVARQRAQLGEELAREVVRLGDDPEGSGPIVTQLRGAWLDVSAALARQDDLALIAACERADEATRRSFDDTLRRDLPPRVEAVVRRQRDTIADAIDHFRSITSAAVRH